jgi:DNA-3-methyladenine glycosylase I
MILKRCAWSSNDPQMISYHDSEWGVPVHDDKKLYEHILLDGFQAGLSWKTILHKRENFRIAFDDFEYTVIASYNEKKIKRLLTNEGIIRNKMKVDAAIKNAQATIRIVEKYGSLNTYLWNFVDGKTLHNSWSHISQIPASSPLSDRVSKELKKQGFSFVGTTICYSFFQAAGLVNDHMLDCFRYKEIINSSNNKGSLS